MGVLDQVIDLKNKGVSENEIVNNLREQGISPKMIENALSQAKIKSAVSASDDVQEGMEPSIMRPEKAEPLPTEGMGPSEADLTPPPSSSRVPPAAQRGFAPMTQEMSEEEYVPRPQEETYESSYSQPQYSAQEYYPQESYGYSPASVGAGDTDTMIEISEQVFSEKVKAIQKQLGDLNEFKTLAQTKIDNISDRLKRIEASIDRLQSAILEKVGSYGRGLDSVKKEMGMMQDSFGKMVNVLTDKAREKHHVLHHTKKTVIHKSGKRHSRKR